ncbi:MAG: hypothetical protein MUC31_01800, partial [Bacteroidales bacterium]|nr:hypothetical protein [Bacteroidales bacterium]
DRHDRHEIRRKIRKAEKEEVEYYCGEPGREYELFRLMEASNPEKSKFLSGNMKPFFKESSRNEPLRGMTQNI